MKIKVQTRKLVAGCSKHCFEVADKSDEVSSKHCFEVVDRTDEVSQIEDKVLRTPVSKGFSLCKVV